MLWKELGYECKESLMQVAKQKLKMCREGISELRIVAFVL